MSEKTPGQVNYETWQQVRFPDDPVPWNHPAIGDKSREAWEAGAKAVIASAAERDEAREKLASIRELCEKRLRVVGMVDGKGVARKVIAIIEHSNARLT